jgi:hypothetical protein
VSSDDQGFLIMGKCVNEHWGHVGHDGHTPKVLLMQLDQSQNSTLRITNKQSNARDASDIDGSVHQWFSISTVLSINDSSWVSNPVGHGLQLGVLKATPSN